MGTLALVLEVGKVAKLLRAEEPQRQPVGRTGLESTTQAPGWGAWEAGFNLTLLDASLSDNPRSRSHSEH